MSPLTVDRTEAVQILNAVVKSQHPRIDLPTIASNHKLTLPELQSFLRHHGYPDKQKMLAAAHRMRYLDDEETCEVPDEPTPKATTPDPAYTASAPYIAALPASQLFADERYQRDLDEARIARMAKTYDPALVGIIEVSKRADTRYAILDGQHRWALVKGQTIAGAPEPHLACRIHTGLSIDDEAKLYHRLNTTRKQLTGWDRWKARVSSGDETAIQIERAAQAAGFTISYRATRGHIRATSPCERVYKLGGRVLLLKVLETIKDAWGDDPEAVSGPIIHGLGHVLDGYQLEINRHRLFEALAGIVPKQLNARAAAARELHKGTLDKLTAHLIIDLYNQVSRSGQLDPFFMRFPPHTANKGTDRRASLEHVNKVRKWALDNGLIKPSDTYVPKEVHEAYNRTHQEEGTN